MNEELLDLTQKYWLFSRQERHGKFKAEDETLDYLMVMCSRYPRLYSRVKALRDRRTAA